MIKQTPLIVLLPIIELLGVIVPQENVHHLAAYLHSELVIICLCGYFGMKRSMFFLLCFWSTWILVTNNLNVIQEYAQIEAGIFMALVFWVYRRPEWIPSDPPSETVQIAFYYGDKSPFIAKVMSLIGLPVTGIALIIGEDAIVPIEQKTKNQLKTKKKSVILEKRTRKSLKKWIKLDTRMAFKNTGCVGKPLISEIIKLEGQHLGYAECMKAFKNVLIQVVPDWSPMDTPSSLMSKMLANRRN